MELYGRCRNENSLRAMVSARPPCRIRCLNTSSCIQIIQRCIARYNGIFIAKKFLRPGRGAGQILPLSAALPSSDRFIPHLAFCRRSKCCNCCPCGKEGGGDFLHEGEGFGAVAWTQTESACRVTVLPSSACTVPCAAICKTRAMGGILVLDHCAGSAACTRLPSAGSRGLQIPRWQRAIRWRSRP